MQICLRFSETQPNLSKNSNNLTKTLHYSPKITTFAPVMILDELKLTCDAPGVRVVQTQRGEVNIRNAYSQWNLCDYTGDDALRVLNARLTFCQQIGIDLDQLVMPRQSHTTHVAVIDQDFLDADIDQQERSLNDIDALVTALPGICIGVNTADCVPIALADPTHGIIAIAHAGWRGTVGRIAQCAVETMCRLGAVPADIHATMGASICADCFEVGDEVPQAFGQAGFDMDDIMHRNASTGKAHIDLWRANRQVLLVAGIPTDHITLPNACSRCHSERYFSARRLGIHSGRTFTAIIRTMYKN